MLKNHPFLTLYLHIHSLSLSLSLRIISNATAIPENENFKALLLATKESQNKNRTAIDKSKSTGVIELDMSSDEAPTSPTSMQPEASQQSKKRTSQVMLTITGQFATQASTRGQTQHESFVEGESGKTSFFDRKAKISKVSVDSSSLPVVAVDVADNVEHTVNSLENVSAYLSHTSTMCSPATLTPPPKIT